MSRSGMPNRSRSGVASSPARVVAPTRVKAARSIRTLRAAGTLADDQVQLKILHRRVEHLLDGRLQAMDLVDEQHVARLQVGQDGREVAGALDHRAGGGAEPHAELARHDLRQRGLAKPRRSMKQNVVKRFAALFAACMKIERFSRLAFWPMNSVSVCGRRLASAASSSTRAADIGRSLT